MIFQEIAKKVICLLVTIQVSGCAFGTKMSYDNTSLTSAIKSDSLALSVWDQRPYVVSGDKSEQFVGLQRSGFGIPFGVHTASGLPLSVEFKQSIEKSLNASGGRGVLSIDSSPKTTKAELLKSLIGLGAQRSLLVTVLKWKSDTIANVGFEYDIVGEIYDSAAKMVAQHRVQGEKALDASFWDPIGSSEELMVEQQQKVFGELLTNQSLVAAAGSSS